MFQFWMLREMLLNSPIRSTPAMQTTALWCSQSPAFPDCFPHWAACASSPAKFSLHVVSSTLTPSSHRLVLSGHLHTVTQSITGRDPTLLQYSLLFCLHSPGSNWKITSAFFFWEQTQQHTSTCLRHRHAGCISCWPHFKKTSHNK